MRLIIRLILNAMIIAASVAAPVQTAHAQMRVIDPTNLAQNLLQAARALEQINNQMRQIDQQAQMLARNHLQLSPELQDSLQRARELFLAAEGLSFEVERLSGELEALYPETFEDFELARIGERTRQWSAENRSAIERAMAAQARAAGALGETQERIERALRSSAEAEGQTGATQAGNQLLGLNAAQLAQIQALLIAQGRALETERLERVAREESGREIQRRAFPGQSASNFAPARSAFRN